MRVATSSTSCHPALDPKSLASFRTALEYHHAVLFQSSIVVSEFTAVYRGSLGRGGLFSHSQPVCVKIFSAPDNALPVEAAVLWALNAVGAQVPRVQQAFAFDGMFALVMDWVEGRADQVGLEDLVDYALQLCRTVSTVHQAGYFSRDVKPQNILWDKARQRLTLLDFDLATTLRGQHWTRVGTEGFMAPEVVRRESYREWVDIYSVAVTLTTIYHDILSREGWTADGNFDHRGFSRLLSWMFIRYKSLDISAVVDQLAGLLVTPGKRSQGSPG